MDYITGDDDDEKKLLRVIVDTDFHASKADFQITAKTLTAVDDGCYDEATIMAEEFTKASKRLVRKDESLEYISPKHKRYSLIELIEAVQNETRGLCEAVCGKFPESAEDCKGKQDGEYTCSVRRVSDDADFHAERRWLELLMNDFSRLIALRREIDS